MVRDTQQQKSTSRKLSIKQYWKQKVAESLDQWQIYIYVERERESERARESLEINPATHGQLIFEKRRQEYTTEKKQPLQ